MEAAGVRFVVLHRLFSFLFLRGTSLPLLPSFSLFCFDCVTVCVEAIHVLSDADATLCFPTPVSSGVGEPATERALHIL